MNAGSVSALLAALLTGGAAVLGTAISGLLMLWNNHISRTSEQRRLLQELAVRAGIEDFKIAADMARFAATGTGRRATLSTIAEYILSAAEVINLLKSTTLTEEQKTERLRELSRVSARRADALESAQNNHRTEPPVDSRTRST